MGHKGRPEGAHTQVFVEPKGQGNNFDAARSPHWLRVGAKRHENHEED